MIQQQALIQHRRLISGNILGAHVVEHILGPSTVAVLIPILYAEFGLTGLQAGLLETVRSIGGATASFLIGIVSDLFAHRRALILVLAITFLGLFYFLLGFSPSYGFALAAILPAGMCAAMWHAPALASMSQLYPERRGLALSAHQSAGNVGDFLGPVILGFALVTFTWRQTAHLALPLTMVVGLVLALALWSKSFGERRSGDFGTELKQQLGDIALALQNRTLLMLVLVTGTRGLGSRAMAIFLALYLSQDLGMSTPLVGLHVGLLALLGVIFGPVLGALSDRIGRKPVLLICLSAHVVFPIIIAWAGGGIGLTVAVALLGIFALVPQALMQAAAADTIKGLRVHASVMGLLWGNQVLFGAIAPLLGGLVADLFGFRAVFYYIAAMTAVSMLLVLTVPMERPSSYEPAVSP